MNYPSGSAGGALAKQYPHLCARQLYKTEWEVAGPAAFDEAIPEGALQGCVAMDANDHGRRIDITAAARGGRLRWDAPEGRWKVMAFVTRRTEDPTRNGIDLADYLNPEAVDTWIRLTYQRFHDRFPAHFGTTIKSSFFDDIGIFQSKPGPRMWEGNEHTCWTDGMNARFREKYGVDPVPLLPALWSDIGPETAAARVMFFGLRAELLAEACVNRQQYQVLIIPGRSRRGVIHVGSLEKIRAFHAMGGTVICTSMLPSRSAELGQDARVQELVREIFGTGADEAPRVFTKRVHPGGGKAFFIPDIDATLGETTGLVAALDEGIALPDVRFEEALPLSGQAGELTCIHKVRDDRDYYFLANSSDLAIDTWVRLRGRIVPEALDPHTGAVGPVRHEHLVVAAREATRIHLVLGPNRSLFIRGGLTMWETLAPVPAGTPLDPAAATGWRPYDAAALAARQPWWNSPFPQRGAWMPFDGVNQKEFAYGRTWYDAPEAGDYELQVGGSPNPQVVWVNGVKVWEGRRNNGYHPNADRVTVTFNKGRNEIMGASNFMLFVGVEK